MIVAGVARTSEGLEASPFQLVVIALFVLVLIGTVVAGVLAFTGRWRSWYPDMFNLMYTPLSGSWFAAAFLFMLAPAGLDAVLGSIPPLLFIPFLGFAMVSILMSLLYTFPPRRVLPRWIQELQDPPRRRLRLRRPR
ncbi:hypothetical protein [Actinomadura sp. 9N407]|uniref:hypothetical protein n=1 Tax=Actinomadura sp. 9N407 TaxID=3375154 RepID=UPI0037B09BE6